MNKNAWENHYHRDKSALMYPDENLVRILKKNLQSKDTKSLHAADIGCGSGRHLQLLTDLGITSIFGSDISFQALALCRDNRFSNLIQSDNKKLPFKDNSIDIAIAWGSLHYAPKEDLEVMLNEIKRILKHNGSLYCTLRSSRDTYLKKGRHLGKDEWITDLNDIQGSLVSFYTEEEIGNAFSEFSSFSYGIIERSIIGDISKVLSHWVIEAIR